MVPILCLAICGIVSTVAGYPSGAPDVACADMIPQHPASTASGTPPFAIQLSSNKYRAGAAVAGQIYSPSGQHFKGFLLQAREVGMSVPLGTFSGFNTTAVHTVCGKDAGQGITHSDPSEKTMINFTWMPPEGLVADVLFNLTVVQSYKPSVFWAGITSPTLSAIL